MNVLFVLYFYSACSLFWKSPPLPLCVSLCCAVLAGHAIFKLTYLSNHDYKALYFESDAATVNEIVLKVRAGSLRSPSPSSNTPAVLLMYACIPHTQGRILHQITFKTSLGTLPVWISYVVIPLNEVVWLHLLFSMKWSSYIYCVLLCTV